MGRLGAGRAEELHHHEETVPAGQHVQEYLRGEDQVQEAKRVLYGDGEYIGPVCAVV